MELRREQEVKKWRYDLRFAVKLDRKIRYEVKDDVNYLEVEFSVLFHYGCYYIKIIFQWKWIQQTRKN